MERDENQPAVELIPVEGSSVVAAQGYDASARVLTIELRAGRRYEYHGVDADTYATFLGAPSMGHYMAHLKATFPYRRLADAPKNNEPPQEAA